jgi:hypothetical protein
VVFKRFVVDAEPAAELFEQIDEFLGVDVDQVQGLVDGKPQGGHALSGVNHSCVPGALALTWVRKIAEKIEKERVCFAAAGAVIVKRSHIVAFRWKVMVVRDTSVLSHWRVPLQRVVQPGTMTTGVSIAETIAQRVDEDNYR